MIVFELPPRLSLSNHVRTESLYGMYGTRCLLGPAGLELAWASPPPLLAKFCRDPMSSVAHDNRERSAEKMKTT